MVYKLASIETLMYVK